MVSRQYPSVSTIKRWMVTIATKHGIPEQVDNTIRHSEVIWRYANGIAQSAIKRGKRIDLQLLKAGCYVHDIGRMVTGSEGSKILKPAISHFYEGYRIMKEKGYPTLAQMCVSHAGGGGLDKSINKKNNFIARDFFPRTTEEIIVAYSDALCSYKRGAGPYIGTFNVAYKRFNKYPGHGARLKVVRKSIHTMTGNTNL